jgi:hypothetical protein
MNGAPIPRGIRNNNPGNLEHTVRYTWSGELLPPDGPYCRFDTAHNGIRALAKDLFNAWKSDGCKTIAQLIGRFAPPADNDTQAYIDDVSMDVAVDADYPFNMTDPELAYDLIVAVIRHENGTLVPYTQVQIVSAMRDANCWSSLPEVTS